MSKVAAVHPGGSARMRAAVAAKVPYSVGNSSESMKEFTDGWSGSFRGYDMSCTGRKDDE